MARERTTHQATHLRIIDGGKSDSSSLQTDELRISSDFVDKVMERIDSEPRVLRDQAEVTIIEFRGPKRPKVKPEEEKESRWNIRNFFRKK